MKGSDWGQTGVKLGSNWGQTTPGFGRVAATVLAFTTFAFGAPVLLARQQQTAPVVNTEIYLADFAAMKAAGPTGAVPLTNISNSPDYDNQPSFTPDGKSILFSSKRDGTQYDIYRYDIATKALTQVTHTPENENSPIVTPDGKAFSVVRTEMDKTQRLWRFDLDGTNPRVILENVKPVGYHAWIDSTHVALFVLGANREPATLQIADTTTGKAEVVASNIGHTILMRPEISDLTYVDKGQKPWMLSTVSPSRTVKPLFPLDVEDFAWEPPTSDHDQSLVMAKDGQLKEMTFYLSNRMHPIEGVSFSSEFGAVRTASLTDLSQSPFTHITRLAISPDGKWIAIVAEPVSK